MQRKKSAPRSKPKARRPPPLFGRGVHAEISQAQEIWLEFFNLYVGTFGEPLAFDDGGDVLASRASHFANRALDAFETRWGEIKLPEGD